MTYVTHTNESCHIHEWVLSHILMVRVTHINQSWNAHDRVHSKSYIPTIHQIVKTQIPWYKFKLDHNLNLNLYHEIPRDLSFSIRRVLRMLYFQWNLSEKWVMARIRMRHVTQTKESCRAYEGVVSHVSRMSLSWEWVMVHMYMVRIEMSQWCVMHVHESYHACECVLVHIEMSQGTHVTAATAASYRYMCIHVCVYVYVCTCPCVYMYVYAYKYKSTYISIYILMAYIGMSHGAHVHGPHRNESWYT